MKKGRAGQVWAFGKAADAVTFVVVGVSKRATHSLYQILVLTGGSVGGGKGAGPWAMDFKAGDESEIQEFPEEPWEKSKSLVRIA